MPLPLAELVAGDVATAAAYLAQRRADVCAHGLTWFEKQANGLSDALSGLGDKINSQPILRNALIGGGLGALGGAGTHLFGGNEADPAAKRRGVLSSALTGGLAGGALGGGIGAAQQFWPGGAGASGAAATTGGGVGGTGSGTPSPVNGAGVFTHPHTGKQWQVNADELKKHPELQQKLRELTAGPSLPERAVSGVTDWIWNNPIAPLTSKPLIAIGALDAMSQSQNLRTGDWFGGEGWKMPASMPAIGGRRIHIPGMIDPRNSTDPAHMEAGIDAALGNKDYKGPREAARWLKSDEGRGVMEYAGSQRNPGKLEIGNTGMKATTGGEITLAPPNRVGPEGGLSVPQTVTHSVAGKPVIESAYGQTQILDNTALRDFKNQGALAEHEMAIGHPGTKERLSGNYKTPVYKGIGGRTRNVPVGALRGMRGLKRLGFYGGIPVAEYALTNLMHDASKRNDIGELMRQYAKEIPTAPQGRG